MKRLKHTKLLIALAVLMQSSLLMAQFSLTGEVRPRTEYRHGFKKPISEELDPAFFTEQRTRLIANYKQDKLILKVSLQDVRIWGAVDQIYKSDPALTAMNEAWGQYLLTDKLSFKVGRQELNYDNVRFLGNLGWAQQSRSHDALLFIYADSTFTVHAGAAFNQDANTPEFGKLTSTFYSDVKNYKTMQYAWANKKFGKSDVSLLVFNNGVQVGVPDTSSVNYSQTIGLSSRLKPGKLIVEAEAYYQMGTDVADKDINAYLLAASITYKGLKKFTPTIGGDFLSGTEADATENNSFVPLYGTNHKFYGFMDYFYVGNGHGNVGLIDLYAKGKIKLSDKVVALAHLHHFMAPVSFYNAGGEEQNSSLGTEIDLVLNVNLASNTNLKLGYSQMFATSSMEVLKGGGDASATNNWAWLMLTFKPTLIKK